MTEKINEIGVRLWTACSFYQDGEVGRGHAFDPLAYAADCLARRNQRRRAVGRSIQ